MFNGRQVNTDADLFSTVALFSTAKLSKKANADAIDAFDYLVRKTKTLKSISLRITPDLAEHIIEKYNTRNRAVRPQRVNEYAKKISEGRMKLHSQGISFSTDGTLNNGQHRLLGVIEAGVPCDFYVTFGEDPAAFDVHDTGGTRTAKDALHIAGYIDTVALAAAVRIIINIDRGTLISNGPETKVDNDEVVSFVDINGSIIDCQKRANKIRHKLRCALAPIAAAIFLIEMHSKNADKLPAFLDMLTDGGNLSSTSPVLKLRDGLQSRKIADEMRNTVARNSNIVAHFINAWNKWNKKQSGSINWKDKREFPEIY